MTPLESALHYIDRGLAPTPIAYRGKRPRLKGWQDLRITHDTAPNYFNGLPLNIGVLLGQPSGWLVDVDLDHPLALARADKYLPHTPAVFGRKSKPRSHRLYRITKHLNTTKFRTESGESIVEIRATGCQTVFPPSVHPSGERIRWEDKTAEPAEVSPDELLSAVARLAKSVKRRLGETEASKDAQAPTDDPTGERQELVDRARAYLDKVPPAVSGNRGHDRAFHAACILRCDFGLSFDEALLAIRDWNRGCEPPWSESELRHKLEQAAREPATLKLALESKRRRARRSRVTADRETDGTDDDRPQIEILDDEHKTTDAAAKALATDPEIYQRA